MFPVPVLEDSVSGDHVDVIVGDLETSAVHSAISEASSSQTQGTACGIDIWECDLTKTAAETTGSVIAAVKNECNKVTVQTTNESS